MLSNVEIEKKSIKASGINTNGKKENSIQDIWDEELETTESILLLELLSEDADKEFEAGICELGGFGY